MLDQRLLSRLQQGVDTALQYEDELLQALALSVIPEERLRAEAGDVVDISRMLGEHPVRSFEDALAEGLLAWFKTFFSWVDKPVCDYCGGQTMNSMEYLTPREYEREGGAQRVEGYHCKACGNCTRFPRYNNPAKLLETRKGRCGEWANCFTLCCRTMGLDARYVLDWSDHVWTEYYSQAEHRWIHMDPCECAYDKPLLYEVGWGKELNYIIGFSKDGVVDVSRRYTRDWPGMLRRRNQVAEPTLLQLCQGLTAGIREGRPAAELSRLAVRDQAEQAELAAAAAGEAAAAPEALQLPGRQTGSEEWRSARGEVGAGGKPPPALPGAATRYRRAGDACGGFVRASGENAPGQTADKAFDGKLSTKWLDFGGGNGGKAWLEYRLPSSAAPLTISHYHLTSAEDAPERDPASFVLQGSLEDATHVLQGSLEEATHVGEAEVTWCTLDEQKDVFFNERHQTLSFGVAAQRPFRRFRLWIKGVRNPEAANSVQLAALRLSPGPAHLPAAASDAEAAAPDVEAAAADVEAAAADVEAAAADVEAAAADVEAAAADVEAAAADAVAQADVPHPAHLSAGEAVAQGLGPVEAHLAHVAAGEAAAQDMLAELAARIASARAALADVAAAGDVAADVAASAAALEAGIASMEADAARMAAMKDQLAAWPAAFAAAPGPPPGMDTLPGVGRGTTGPTASKEATLTASIAASPTASIAAFPAASATAQLSSLAVSTPPAPTPCSPASSGEAVDPPSVTGDTRATAGGGGSAGESAGTGARPKPIPSNGGAGTTGTGTATEGGDGKTAARENFAKRLREEFARLMAGGGMSASQAAALALKLISSQPQ